MDKYPDVDLNDLEKQVTEDSLQVEWARVALETHVIADDDSNRQPSSERHWRMGCLNFSGSIQ